MPKYEGLLFVSLILSGSDAYTAPFTVSVAIVTKNRAGWLSDCIEQVASQTLCLNRPCEMEVIIIDDTETGSCRGDCEEFLGRTIDEVLPCALSYIYLPESATIGFKRNLAASMARGVVIAHWDDDDVFGCERLEAQIEPIISGEVEATIATPERWTYADGPPVQGCTRETLATPLDVLLSPAAKSQAFADLDPDCRLGLEIVDEAICSLCFRRDLWGETGKGGATFPDVSMDEDKAFLNALKQSGARVRRLPPQFPPFEHTKHRDSVVKGPLTLLYSNKLGGLAEPLVALPLLMGIFLSAVQAIRVVT